MKPESLMMSYGYNPMWSEGAVKSPIFQTSTFVFQSAKEGKRFFEIAYGKGDARENESLGLIYSRINNPNMQILEERLALLEGSEEAAAFESGMSAITTVMLAYLKPGDVLMFSNPVYGGTHHFIHHYLIEQGIHIMPYAANESVEDIMTRLSRNGWIGKVKLVYVETPANPTNILFDLALLSTLKNSLQSAGAQEVKLVVDNTYMGPLWQKPMAFGADIVCYSATKFLNGHSDVIAGAVMAGHAEMKRIRTLRTFLGNMIAPYTAWLLTRSLETLHIRMERQTANAKKVAAYLLHHERISRVLFPGIVGSSSQQEQIFREQCLEPGAMIAFEVEGGEESAFQVLDHLKLIKLAVSLGSNESLAQHPYTMTHADVPDDEKILEGITPGLVRLSVGIEHSDDIIADLEQALQMAFLCEEVNADFQSKS
ncbi:MAG: aminotransferase class I/II-fold pyridoxal phosphate-dependent enzyme [Chitinophagaceae bacterium]